MSPSLPIGPLTDLARSRTEDAARRLAACQIAKTSASLKLELLLQYRRDYSAQLKTLMQDGLDSAQWRNYQNFLATLDGGIEQQRAAAVRAEAGLDHGRSDWQHQHRRLSAFETLAERMQREQSTAQARREQRDSDEQAARMFLDRSSAQANPHRELP
jgi:flagellar FliJ protein